MKTLYIDPVGGLAGDMLCAALFDAGLDFQEWREKLEKLNISLPELTLEVVQRGPFRAAYFCVQNPKSASHHHSHSHGHSSHSHSHHHDLQPVEWEDTHRSWKNIQNLLSTAQLDDKTRQHAYQVFEKLAEAEARVHGVALDDVHFHEVGAIDSIIDIIGFCLGCTLLGVEQILYAKLPISGGMIWSAHGKIPLPAPATLELIKGLQTRKGMEGHEQITPTGAAILSALGQQKEFPPMTISSVGYGAGTRNPAAYANVVRISLGKEEKEVLADRTPTEIIEIQTNIDDMSGEDLPFLQQQLLRSGALDVSVQSIIMKKGRPAWLLTVLSPIALLENITHCIFQHSSSFGLRYSKKQRCVLHRSFQTVETSFGSARIKQGRWKDIEKISVEYEDAKRIAEAANLSLQQSQALILQQWKQL